MSTTDAEREAEEADQIRTFVTNVSAVDTIHPHLRQITFGGGDLTTFQPLGPDTFCYLLLPAPGQDRLGIDQSFTWELYSQMPPEARPVGAYYTVRRWRPETSELDMLVVLHDDAGQASGWAARAEHGDEVALWGPRTAYHPPHDTDRLMLVADETGLPAVAAILEELPDGVPARVFAEVADQSEQHQLPTSPAIEVTWLYRNGAPPGTTTLLADAVRDQAWSAGRPYVWGGGESRVMTSIREYVRNEIGLQRDSVSLVAYWRLGD